MTPIKRGDRVEVWTRARTERVTINPRTHEDTRVWTGTVADITDRAARVRYDDDTHEWVLFAELTKETA